MNALRIIHRHTDGTTLSGARATGAAADTLGACGWRYSLNTRRWYVPYSQNRVLDRELIGRTEAELTRAGYVVDVELHVRPRAVEDLAIDPADDRGTGLPQDVVRRIERLQRRIRTIARALYGYRNHLGVVFPAASGAERDDLLHEHEQLSRLLRYWQDARRSQLGEGAAAINQKVVSPGDLVEHRGAWCPVIRTNRVTVSLRCNAGGNWIETVPYHQLTGHQAQNL